MSETPKPLVGIVMGSDSDLPTLRQAEEILEEFQVPCEIEIVSAHRTPQRMFEYARTAVERGLKVIIAGAGGSAHLPGMIAAITALPVIGVPIISKTLNGIDSLLSIVQMPAGVPVATVAIGAGKNAGLLAVQILSVENKTLLQKMETFKKSLSGHVEEKNAQIFPSAFKR